MRRLDRARSVDRPIQAVVATLERWLVFAPHVMDDLARFAKHGHALARLGEPQAVGVPLVGVPPGAKADDQPSMAECVDGRRHLGQDRRIAVAKTRHHLADLHAAGVTCQGGGG